MGASDKTRWVKHWRKQESEVSSTKREKTGAFMDQTDRGGGRDSIGEKGPGKSEEAFKDFNEHCQRHWSEVQLKAGQWRIGPRGKDAIG